MNKEQFTSIVSINALDRKAKLSSIFAEKTYDKKRLRYSNETKELDVYEIPINLPTYRLSNGRTITAQNQYIYKNNLDTDYFTKNKGAADAEIMFCQHQILNKLIDQQSGLMNLKNYFSKSSSGSANAFTEEIIITQEGVVVNGNRRLCALRELYAENKQLYSEFQKVRAAVLPYGTTESEILEIERVLQNTQDIKQDYDWVSLAGMYERELLTSSMEEVNKRHKHAKKQDQPENLIPALKVAEKYLVSGGLGKFVKGKFIGDASSISNAKYAFIEWAHLRQISETHFPTLTQDVDDSCTSVIGNLKWEGKSKEKHIRGWAKKNKDSNTYVFEEYIKEKNTGDRVAEQHEDVELIEKSTKILDIYKKYLPEKAKNKTTLNLPPPPHENYTKQKSKTKEKNITSTVIEIKKAKKEVSSQIEKLEKKETLSYEEKEKKETLENAMIEIHKAEEMADTMFNDTSKEILQDIEKESKSKGNQQKVFKNSSRIKQEIQSTKNLLKDRYAGFVKLQEACENLEIAKIEISDLIKEIKQKLKKEEKVKANPNLLM